MYANRLMGVALGVVVTLCGDATAQIDNGRALDANLQVGQGPENPEVPQLLPATSDLIMTGNVTGGRSFQGYAPLAHPNTLRVGIPSSSLSDFRRDSFGLSNYAPNSLYNYGDPYFAPERNATSAFNALRPLSLNAADGAANAFNLRRSDLNNPLSVPLNFFATRTLNNSGDAAIQLDLPYMQTLQTLENAPGSMGGSKVLNPWAANAAESGETAKLQLPFDELVSRNVGSVSPTLTDNPLNLATPAEETEGPASALDIEQGLAVITDRAAESSADPANALDAGQAAAAAAAAGVPVGVGLSVVLPPQSGHPFMDFQTALAWMEDYRNTAQEEDGLTTMPETPAYSGSFERAEQILEQSLTTFAGDTPSLAADYLRQAETLLKNGEFARSTAMYRLSATLEPNNPLIDLGLGHALIGSGDFRSAFMALARGIERFPGFQYFRIDLSVFLTDPSLLDRRRAELEEALSTSEDYQMRFLLAYTEYFSGLPQFGIENFKKAAMAAPENSIVRKVPALLSKQPFWSKARKP